MSFNITQKYIKTIDRGSHKNPYIYDLRYQATMYERLDLENEKYIQLNDDVDEIKVGIIGDVHQNTQLLSDTLNHYRSQNVKVGLFLGDYSFIPSHLGRKDPFEIRYIQFKTAIDLIIDWVHEDSNRHAAIILGNHEIDPNYFIGGHNSPSYKKIKKYFHNVLNTNPRIFGHSNPLNSYEYDNALDIFIQGGGIGTRTFRMAHAISDSFVMSMYMGLRDDPTKKKQQLSDLEEKIGPLWLESIKPRIDKAKLIWGKFKDSDFDKSLINEITSNVKSSMNVNSNLNELLKIDNKWNKTIDLYINKYSKDYEFLSEYFDSFFMTGNDFRYLGHEFAYALRTMYRKLGVSGFISYNIIGHFHIDLGIFETSEEFATNLIGVSGFQPNKIIADQFTSYIIELTQNKVDKIYELSVPHTEEYDDPFSCDLSFDKWNKSKFI